MTTLIHRIMKSIDDVLHLSQLYSQEVEVCEPGAILVQFIFSIVWQLLEASLDDEGLLDHAPHDKSVLLSRDQRRRMEGLRAANTATAIQIIAQFLQNKFTSRILSLVHRNM